MAIFDIVGRGKEKWGLSPPQKHETWLSMGGYIFQPRKRKRNCHAKVEKRDEEKKEKRKRAEEKRREKRRREEQKRRRECKREEKKEVKRKEEKRRAKEEKRREEKKKGVALLKHIASSKGSEPCK
jgi:FtsZ-interacting cell division protein ZipA